MGRHSVTRRDQAPRKLIEMVDALDFQRHRLSRDAAAGPEGRYVALCGAAVLPAALVEPGSSHCRRCIPGVVPAQRSRFRWG
jgi:hypothetical protein